MTAAGGRADPCMSCGACCSSYRVSFYWAECDDTSAGGVPVGLTERVNEHRCAMRGTQSARPRCIALTGRVGEQVHCRAYPQRPSPCREFMASFEHGRHEPRCDNARSLWDLPPLRASDWRDPS